MSNEDIKQPKGVKQKREEYYRNLAEGYVVEANRFVPGYSDEMLPAMFGALESAGPGGVVADLGCGPGHISKMWHERQTPRKMHCVDESKEMAELARENLKDTPGVEIHQQDICTFLSEDPLAAVLSSLTIHNIAKPDKEPLLRHIFGMLQPGGVFVWSDLTHFEDPERQRKEVYVRKQYALERGADPKFVEENFKKEGEEDFLLTTAEMVALLNKVGFVDIKVIWERTTFAIIETRNKLPIRDRYRYDKRQNTKFDNLHLIP